MKITFKSTTNANGRTGIVINAFRLKMFLKSGSLTWFDAGYNF